LLKSLYRRFVESDGAPQSITPDRLLAVALRFSHEPPLGLHDISSALRDILQISAKRGNVAACALASRYSLRLKPPHNTGEITKWLQTAIKTGSLIARDDLYQIDTEATGDAVRCFINRGGLNQAYWDLERIPLQPSPITATSVDRLHWLSAFGTVEDLKTYLSRTSGTYVNAISERRETALYLACVRGSWGHVEVLLDYRADPAIKCTASEFTCLHWAIGFDTAVCKTVVQELIKAGAEVNALVSLQDTPFPHYPFVLPAGTPLHWAVATSRHVTIKALIDAGANALQRNNSDPYMYDDRVRWLYAIGGPNSEGCTFPEADCLGLSSLDIAAIYRDPFLFQTHVDKSAHIDMDSADEEGFTVLHRLATNQTFRTSRRITYSPRPFRNATDAKVLRAIVKAVLILGGNIEILTSSAETTKRKEQRPTDLDKASYTPLMLAMLEGDKDLVETLLDCGASVHTENLVGETALFHTSHRANAAQPDLIRCVRKLISRGADVNHHSSNGNCALLSAAQSRLIPVFDFLLSKDASIDERDCMEHTLTPGKSVFASFASNRDGSDEEVLELLKTHVLNARNAAKKGRVVQGSADNGQTLLHEFVAFAMPQCAELVLQHGARVNALHRRTTFMKDNQPNEGKKIWYETPWDAIAVSKSYFDDSMSAQVTRSLQQLTNVQARWEECEELLKSHGGVACQECEHYEAWP
jgi:ankyrin repeat protein